MDLEPRVILLTGLAALLFAASFAAGEHFHPIRMVVRNERSALSFCAGMSAAYVFVKLMPEMSEARKAFAESVSFSLWYGGMAVYFLALVGFLCFYGLEQLRWRLHAAAEPKGEAESFAVHVCGFAAYVGLMAYLLVRRMGDSTASTALYAVAFTAHFLTLGHTLHEEHGNPYKRTGRWVLAAMCVVGWGVGVMVALPPYVLALLVAFVSGAVIMNSTVMELPSDRAGTFVPFMAGGLLYGLLLLPLA